MLRRMRIPEKLARDLEQLIQRGVWHPGEQLPPERKLAARFRVSRASVRDALRMLELAGWVEIRQGDGTRVAQPAGGFGRRLLSRLHDPAFVAELFELRRILEPAAAALAAQRAGAEEFARLEELLLHQREARDDRYTFVELDLDFHWALAEASHNTALCEVLRLLGGELRQTRLSATTQRFEPEITLEEHWRILEAVKQGNAVEAEQAMLEHLRTVERGASIPPYGERSTSDVSRVATEPQRRAAGRPAGAGTQGEEKV